MRSLIQSDALIHRKYFKEVLDAYGVPSLYFQCKPKKDYNSSGELSSRYYDPQKTKVLFEQVPQMRTLKKLGWVTELDQQQPIVHLWYDLPGIEVGCLLKVKDPFTKSSGRFFRLSKLSGIGIIYPVGLTAQIVAVAGTDIEDTVDPYSGRKSIFLDKQTGVD